MSADPLQHAIQLVESGQYKEARQVLQPLLQADPRNISAWYCYIATCKTLEQRIQALETCSRFNPDNADVKQRLEQLRAKLPPVQAQEPQAVTQASPANRQVENKRSAAPSETAPARDRKTNPSLRWLLWSLVAALSVGFIALLVVMIRSTPPDPLLYRYAEPSEYFLYVPPSYQAGQEWPLVIGFHGFGGSGHDCWKLWQSYAEREGYILLCPTLADADGGWFQDEGERKLLAILQQVEQTVQVEPQYILVGFSAGAQFVQGMTFDYPDAVKAAVVLSAGNYMAPPDVVRGIPFLLIIGDADDAGAVETSQYFADDLLANGASVEYWLLPGVGHEVTEKTRQLTIDFIRRINGK